MKLFLQKKLSTYIFSILGVLFALWTIIPAVSVGQFADEPFPYDVQGQEYNPTATSEENMTNLATDVIKTDTQTSTSVLQRLTNFFRLSGTSYNPGGTNTSTATNYVKRILNILLGLVSFLSLVMIIFAFYLIFFSKGEEGAAKAKKILIGVGIALAIMWLSRFIASFFFNIYTVVTT